MKTIGIFGLSGFAREVADIAYELSESVMHIAENKESLGHHETASIQVIIENDICDLDKMEYAIGIGDNRIRKKIAEKYKGKLKFINLISSHATFGRRQLEILKERTGLIICAGVRLTNNIKIGDYAIINLNSTIGHDVEIGDYVNIAPGANVSGNVTIKPGVWIGSGAVINQGTETDKIIIGDNTIVGSGAVVVKSCDANAVYAGVPARRIK